MHRVGDRKVGHKHMSSFMSDHFGQLILHRDGLWSHAARPEHRNMSAIDTPCDAPLWRVEVDTDLRRIADVNWAAMRQRESRRDGHGLANVLRYHGTGINHH